MQFDNEIITTIKSLRDKIAEICDNYSDTSSDTSSSSSSSDKSENKSSSSSLESEPTEPNNLTVRIDTNNIENCKNTNDKLATSGNVKNIIINFEQKVPDRAKKSKEIFIKQFDKILTKHKKLAARMSHHNKCYSLFDFIEHICTHKKRYFAFGISILESIYIVADSIKRYT